MPHPCLNTGGEEANKTTLSSLHESTKVYSHDTYYSHLIILLSVSNRPEASKEVSRFGVHMTVHRMQLLIAESSKQLTDGSFTTTKKMLKYFVTLNNLHFKATKQLVSWP